MHFLEAELLRMQLTIVKTERNVVRGVVWKEETEIFILKRCGHERRRKINPILEKTKE
jgi:hypothetical protein